MNNQIAEELLRDLEIWLKAILFLIEPIAYTEKNKKTLVHLLKPLDLLKQIEIDKKIDTHYEINDSVRQKILLAYRHRNDVTHSPQEINGELLSFTLVTLIAPIIKHYDKISLRLQGLISSELPYHLTDTINLLHLFEGERRSHLEIFGGRDLQLEMIQNRLEGDLRKRGAYLLLTGLEGSGKSALCAKLIDNLTKQVSPIGRYAGEVRKHAPWLPGVIFHSGKQSRSPIEIAQSIINQANTMLLRPFDIDFTQWNTSPLRFDDTLDYRQNDELQDIENTTLSYVSNVQKQDITQIRSQKKAPLPLREDIRRRIYSTLEKVVDEYGSIILIIDALDEISAIGKDLYFLPARLPSGVSALLTTRDNTKASEFAAYHYENEKIRLRNLEKDEIPFIIKADKAEQSELKMLQEKTWEKSGGLAIIVADVARKAKSLKNLDGINVGKTLFDLFERQAREWTESPNRELLHQTLLLLAIFEPACPLELSLVQGFLEHMGYSRTQSEVRNLIRPIAYQVEGLDEG